MSVFRKKLKEGVKKKLPIHPIELFQELYHQEGFSYLRGVQEEVLNQWHQIRDHRDVLCKMNTGSGKTLVSLLMLYSKMTEGVGPGLYLCPDNQLLEQTRDQAKAYGVPVCEIEEGNQFPNAFLNSESILLCTFQKLFTGRSIFERDQIRVGAIVLDDAHKCLDKAREATTIYIPQDHELYERLIEIFKDELDYQAPGTFYNLLKGDPHASILKVPYWSWLSNHNKLIELFGEYSEDKDLLFFKWPLIADDLKSFDCFVGQRGLEIAPVYVPYHKVPTFNEASHRYILSATFEGQLNLIKDLGIDKDSIKEPLLPTNRRDIGQRLIIAPQRFDLEIDDGSLRILGHEYASRGKNVVVMVPSFERAKEWEGVGATIISKENIGSAINNLSGNLGGFYVLVNRYDGIDLAGDMCRLLIIDGYPGFSSYRQLYTERRLDPYKASIKAQIIDQGLGRAVRSGSDYCSVILMGSDLLRFVGNTSHLQYFTPFTRRQLDAGLRLLDDEKSSDSIKTVTETIDACLNQEEDWRLYHSQILDDIDSERNSTDFEDQLDIAKVELDSSNKFRNRGYQEAADKILQIVNGTVINLPAKQKAWFLELAARYYFLQNSGKANELQRQACETAPLMLQPSTGYLYQKIRGSEAQENGVLKYASQFENSRDFKIEVRRILSYLRYSKEIPHRMFENSFSELGRLLGFHAQEPEEEFSNGPDILWALTDNHFLIFEAKSQSEEDVISRASVEQLLNSEAWFRNAYGEHNEYHLVLLQSTRIKDDKANINEKCRVISQDSLELLKQNVEHFVNGLISYGHHSATSKEVRMILSNHNLNPGAFRDVYLKDIKSKKPRKR